MGCFYSGGVIGDKEKIYEVGRGPYLFKQSETNLPYLGAKSVIVALIQTMLLER